MVIRKHGQARCSKLTHPNEEHLETGARASMNIKAYASAVAVMAIAAALVVSGSRESGASTSQPSASRWLSNTEPVLMDANEHMLGPLIDSPESLRVYDSQLAVTFYSRRLDLLIPVDGAGNVGIPATEWFTSSNCTGTAYYWVNAGGAPDPALTFTLLSNGNGSYFKIGDRPQATLAMNSKKVGALACSPATNNLLAVPMTPVTSLPFTTPIRMPLHLAP
jgi:hypothetical protein